MVTPERLQKFSLPIDEEGKVIIDEHKVLLLAAAKPSSDGI